VQDREGHWGVWRTIRGTHVFIRDGESAEEAFRRTTGHGFDDAEPSTRPKFIIEGHKDAIEERIIRSALKRLPEKDLEGLNKVIVVDEADLFEISGKRINADASFTKSTGELRIERYLLTSTELNRVLFHEVGHNVWKHVSSNDRYNWKGTFQRGLSHGYKFPSYYATTNAEEAFCECYAFHKQKQSGKIDGIFRSHLKNIIKEES